MGGDRVSRRAYFSPPLPSPLSLPLPWSTFSSLSIGLAGPPARFLHTFTFTPPPPPSSLVHLLLSLYRACWTTDERWWRRRQQQCSERWRGQQQTQPEGEQQPTANGSGSECEGKDGDGGSRARRRGALKPLREHLGALREHASSHTALRVPPPPWQP